MVTVELVGFTTRAAVPALSCLVESSPVEWDGMLARKDSMTKTANGQAMNMMVFHETNCNPFHDDLFLALRL